MRWRAKKGVQVQGGTSEPPPFVVTGTDGFIGGHLLHHCRRRGLAVHRVLRRPGGEIPLGWRESVVPDLAEPGDLSFEGPQAVVHTAGLAHRSFDSEAIDRYRRSNVDATMAVWRAAVAAGTKVFVHLSTVKAGAPSRDDVYARSKREAERALLVEARAEGSPRLVIVRPFLVHGPGAKGNLARLLGALNRRLPLPLACAHGRRRLTGLDNLCEAILGFAEPSCRYRGVVSVSDPQTITTADLTRVLALGLGTTPRLFPVPAWGFRMMTSSTGCGHNILHLFRDDKIPDDGDHLVLEHSLRPGLIRMARAFAAHA